MGRKLTDEELNDPDFQALLLALKKASKPVGRADGSPLKSPPERKPSAPSPGSSADVEQ